MSGNERDYDEIINLAEEYGLIYCNELFRTQERNLSMGKRVRFTSLEVTWMFISAIASFLFFGFLTVLLGGILPVPFGTMFLPIWVIICTLYGRTLANTSPLRKDTGEGTGVWIKITLRNAMVTLSRLSFFPESMRSMKNYCWSDYYRRPGKVECVEWLGTARATRMPKRPNPQQDINNDTNGGVIFYTRGRSVSEKEGNV